MFAAALIVFRETLEASLIIGIMAAATRGIAGRERHILGGVFAGLAGAALVAASMETISNLASGVGQEIFNAGVLALAVGMLAWHNIWMSSHGRELAANLKSAAKAVHQGSRTKLAIVLVIAVAVLREGAETVLFLFGLATGTEGGLRASVLGGTAGLALGVAVGWTLYAGLLRIPVRWFFSATSALVLLLAAGLAAQAAHYLIQADLIPAWGAPVWDTSGILSDSSALGTVLHGLVGYVAQPAGMQLAAYVAVLLGIGAAMVWVGRNPSAAAPKAA